MQSAPAAPAAPCPRCHGSGLGNVCFFSRVDLIAQTDVTAAAVTRALVSEIASMPSADDRERRVNGFLNHHSNSWVDKLRKAVARKATQ